EILRSNKDLEQFAYIASHDLQEPLRIVSNYAEILKMKYKDKFDDKGKKFADNIIDNIYRMQELINDLLSYSSLGKEKTFREIDMQKVCRQVTKNLGLLIKETGAEISCQELPKIIGDE